jgi:hypothetical protein
MGLGEPPDPNLGRVPVPPFLYYSNILSYSEDTRRLAPFILSLLGRAIFWTKRGQSTTSSFFKKVKRKWF